MFFLRSEVRLNLFVSQKIVYLPQQMRCRVSYQRVKQRAALLLAVLLTWLCCNTLFIHTHIFEGRVVAHSHFYTHTHSQLQHLLMLSEQDALQGSVAFDFFVTPLLCALVIAGIYRAICREQLCLSLRAPPASI